MAVGQLPDQVGEFAKYLRELLGRLDQDAGWCGVFWQRDPDGMRACVDGAEVPPWDVVQALLHDLAADRGVPEAERERGRAQALHRASLDAYDARPGGRELLGDRLDMMLREQRVALERQADLSRQLAAALDADEADRINLDLAWVRDDHERATARCAELRERMDRLTEVERPTWVDLGAGAPGGDFSGDSFGGGAGLGVGAGAGVDAGGGVGGGPGGGFAGEYGGGASWGLAGSHGVGSAEGFAGEFAGGFAGGFADYGVEGGGVVADGHAVGPAPVDDFDPAPAPRHSAPDAGPHVPRQGPERSRRRPRGARFAGFGDSGGQGARGPVAGPEPASAGEPPRGARFPQVAASSVPSLPAAQESDPHHTEAQTRPGGHVEAAPGSGGPGPDTDARATSDAVRDLIRLRGEGRSGEAHGVLVEATAWPAARLPLFAGELHRAGLGADWATLLWEAASLPPDRLVALADALAGAGRGDDCRKLLRQGVARPAPEIAEAILALMDADREREARALLDSYVRVRTSEDVARCAHTDPHRLIPVLLETAKGVSDEHHWDLVHALRVAGFSA
ncbi:hypothetical protein [Streptomyces sp. NPDC005865]|uniref:hypothetical protein n=1 Tax=Streptomyces sp. NPDC005865 TaxID=3155453 RepID=UPI0033D01464